MELKPFRHGFVLAVVFWGYTSPCLADVLPPPPPPPPGVGTAPTPNPPPTSPSETLEPPPPPPPGVNIEPPPQKAPDKPAPSKTQPTPTNPPPTTTTSVPIDGVPPPPPPPDGVEVPRQTPPPNPPRQTSASTSESKTIPNYNYKYAQKEKPSSWYGWQSMLGLAPVYALYLGATYGDEEILYVPAFIGGVLVTPIAHWVHKNRRRGWLSFGFNFGTQAIGAAANGAEGAMIGMGIWNVIDVAFLHYIDDPEPAQTPRPQASFMILPVQRPDYKGFTVVGQF